ncbi:MAG TPA: oxygen-dependent coproporphyrinogen oxidase [Kofleriaceae bacterium]
MPDLFDSAAAFFHDLQRDICNALEELDAGGKDFGTDAWQRPGGGGGLSRVLEGGLVFEKAGVNTSNVEGELPAELAEHMPGTGRAFRAAGISLVLHPRSPMVPTTHANFRCIAKGDAMWFGGGADLTPYYLQRDDAVHFHRTLAEACDRHAAVASYDRFKAWCDEYFFLPHRGETRGIGGVFFDYLGNKGEPIDEVFAFVQELGRAFLPAYLPIARRRMGEPYGELERAWHLQRRGRYVEFNLLYDRGTLFGLKTSGRIESILMSLPPLVRWDYDVSPQPGSPEAALLAALRPTDWIVRPKL